MTAWDVRPYQADDADDVVGLSLSAWAPVFESMEKVVGTEIFERLHPDRQWRVTQERDVRGVCDANPVWVAVVDGEIAGFVAVDVESDEIEGEIVMIAVDPDHQREGIGAALFDVGVEQVRAAGLPVARVGTGGDPGHAPARATYEKAGFTPLPVVQYLKAL
jgi:ribosomal protein S18 acetylase RimI-like enzyme